MRSADAFAEWFGGEITAGRADRRMWAEYFAAWEASTAAERERCAKIVRNHDPDAAYLTDESGEEYPEEASWDSQKERVASLILNPEHQPPE
jgi:hypothetical protein